jgi:hypothetical protein
VQGQDGEFYWTWEGNDNVAILAAAGLTTATYMPLLHAYEACNEFRHSQLQQRAAGSEVPAVMVSQPNPTRHF